MTLFFLFILTIKKNNNMATLKEGLDYFPLSVDFVFDDLEEIMMNHGSNGCIVVLGLMSRIFKQGYYLEYDERLKRKIARKISEGIDTEMVDKVVQEAASQGIFNEDMLAQYHILTSGNIQLDYFRAVKRRKKELKGELRYLLIEPDLKYKSKSNVPDEIDPNFFREALPTLCENDVRNFAAKEREVKESKGKESKEKENKESVSLATLARTDNAGVREKVREWEVFINKLIKDEAWIDGLKSLKVADDTFFDHLSENMVCYCQWLAVTGEYTTISNINDFSRRLFHWIRLYYNKKGKPSAAGNKDQPKLDPFSKEAAMALAQKVMKKRKMEEEE